MRPVRSASVLTSSLRLRPTLLRLRTQSPLGRLLQPIRLPLHSAHLKIVLPARTSEHLRPALNSVLDLLPRLAQLLLPELLLLRRDVRLVEVRHVHGHVRPLRAAQVGRRVLRKAARDETPRGVFAREHVVAAARAVDAAAGRDVVDRAVERQIDRFVGVAAVVGEELGVG